MSSGLVSLVTSTVAHMCVCRSEVMVGKGSLCCKTHWGFFECSTIFHVRRYFWSCVAKHLQTCDRWRTKKTAQIRKTTLEVNTHSKAILIPCILIANWSMYYIIKIWFTQVIHWSQKISISTKKLKKIKESWHEILRYCICLIREYKYV